MSIRSKFRGWLVVLAASVGISSNPGQFAFGAVGLFIIPLTAEFGWQRTEVSFALTVFTIALAFAIPLVGKLVDRFGARTVLIPSTIVFGLLLASIPVFVDSLLKLWVVYFLIGTLAAGANALPYLRIIGAWFDRHRGLAFGIAMAGGGIGYTYVPPMVQYLIDHYAWRYGYFALAGIVLFLTVPLVVIFLRDPPEGSASSMETDAAAGTVSDTAGEPATLADLLESRTFWMLFGVFLLLSVSLFGLLSHLVPMLIDRGMPADRAALVAATLGATIIVSRAAIGWAIDRFFAPRVATVCVMLSAAGLVLLATGAVDAAAFLAAILIGLSIGAEIDLLAYLATRYFGLQSFGLAYGLLFSAFLVGSASGPVAYGASFDVAGSYATALIVCAGLLLITTLVLQLLPAYERPADNRE
ncbi:MAG: MFS transporter [Woeseiaceae bacterium]|nr:MFS transporter [Woeseiaceae bacterium]